MNRSEYRLVRAALPVRVAFFTIIAGAPGLSVLAAGSGGGRCHCPCSLDCGGGVTCDCTTHSEDCNKCVCGSVHLESATVTMILADEKLSVQGSFADWFGFAPFSSIDVGIEAAVIDQEKTEVFRLRLVPAPEGSLRYVPDEKFDIGAFRAWAARVDSTRGAQVHVAAKENPATYTILDGNLAHMNESLRKTFSLVSDSGDVVVFQSDATLAWEMLTYLRSSVSGTPEEAFRADAALVRARIYGMINTLDLMIKTGDFPGALATLDEIDSLLQSSWLQEGDREVRATRCAFRKMRNLLVPGSGVCSS